MKNLLFIVLVFILFIACKKTINDKLVVTGNWIESTQGKDTITFVKADPEQIFTLKRQGMAKYTSGGLMPVGGAGPYVYTLSNDTIALRPLVSNSLYTPHFYFNLDTETNQLSIGNFYDDTKTRGVTLTFTKMP